MPVKLQLPPIADEYVFEDFVLNLFSLNYPDANFQLFGKKGNRQKGIDIISTQTGIAIQCKLKERSRIGLLKELKQDFKSDIKKIIHLKYKIRQLIFVSTFDDNAHLIEHLQMLKQQMNLPFDVTYIGWQSLSNKVQFHPVLLEKFFPQYFKTKSIILSPIPFFDIHQLQDGEDILYTLDTFSAKYQVFIIQGIGGVGKTVALSCYVNENKERYDHIIWAECSLASAKASILATMPFAEISENKNQKPVDLWNTFCYKLLSIKGENLIIIDGVEQSEDDIYNTIEDIAATGWHVIITSRIRLTGYPAMELNGLTNQGAMQLFKKYFTKSIDEYLLEKFIKLLENHPLLVELAAKAGNANKKMSLQQLYTLLSNNNLKSPALQREINVGKHSRRYTNKRHQNIYKYLLLCFDITNLTKTEQLQLLYFSVFPASQPIDFDNFIRITEQKENKLSAIEQALNKLEENGWLTNRGETYFIHPLIQIVVREKLAISVPKIKSLVLGCINQLKDINSVNPWILSDKITIAKNILQATELSVESLYLSLLYATAISKMGNYMEAIHHYTQCEAFAVKNHITDPEFLGGLFNNLGNAYRFVGSYNEAAAYLLMAIQIKQASDNIEEPISLAMSMDNYASVLEAIGHYKESAAITKQAIEIFKEEKSQRNLCQAYINLASTYYRMQQFEKAKWYWRKGHNLLAKDSDPELISSSFNTLGIVLQAQARYRLAKEAFIKGIKTHKDSPNPDVLALLYSNLSSVQFQLLQFEKGKANLQKAIELNESIEGNSKYNKARISELKAKYYIHEQNYREAVNSLKDALSTYLEIFDQENDDCIRVREELRALQTGTMNKKAKSIYANNLFCALKEYMCILYKLLQYVIDQYGIAKGLRSKKDAAFVHDYIFFCATKSCKSYASVITLIKKEKAEDALILLYSVYRNYLTTVYVKNYPEVVDFFITVPIKVSNGQIKRSVDEEGIIDVTQILNSDNSNVPLYPSLSRLVKGSPNPEDKIVHNYFDPQLSDHVYSNFMTSGNYRDDKGEYYRYNGNSIIVQPLLIGTYLQVLTLYELMTFVNDNNLNRKLSKFIRECVPLLISLIEFGNLDVVSKKAMVARLKKTTL